MIRFHQNGGGFKTPPYLQSQKAHQQLRNQRPEEGPRCFHLGSPYNSFRSRRGYNFPSVPFAGRCRDTETCNHDTTGLRLQSGGASV